MKLSRLGIPLLLGVATVCLGQTTPDMATGLSPYATYIPSEIDNVNPANGNIFIKIPLLGYPQKGSRLRLNFYIYYNDKQWQANLAEVFPTNGSSYVAGQWTPAGVSLSTPSGASSVPSPAGVYVARDQFLGFGSNYNQTKVQNVGGLGGDSIIESTSYLTKWVYTPDGSVHYVGDGVNESVACGPTVGGGACPAVPGWGNDTFLNTYPATDGSGYDQNGHDPQGNAYTSNSVTDPNGNTITWSSGGWTDTIGRIIPGGTSGTGTNEFPNATSVYAAQAFFDLVPGTASGVPSQCPTGTSAGRTWTVPASTSNGGSATYYLCYTSLSFQSGFNTSSNLLPGNQIGSVPEGGSTTGLGQALLLTAIVLPNLNKYTFQYDSYLSLSQLGLPSGGTISYTWQNIAFRPLPTISTSWSGIATPISRALASRTVNPGNGQPSITTTYHWNITKNANCIGANCNQGVSFPAYSIVTDHDGNDTEYTLGGTDEYGVTWNDYVVTGVASYAGCSPHNPTCSPTNPNPLKSVTYGLTPIASGGAPQESPAFVPLVGTLPPTKVTQETTHLQTSSGSYILSRTKSLLTPMYGTCTVYSYPEYSTPGSQPFPSIQRNSCYGTNQISSTATYDWGTPGSGSVGPLLKAETKTFAWEQAYVSSVPSFSTAGSTVYPLSIVPNSTNMLNLVDTDVITDGSGNWMAESDYCYDSNGNNTSVQKFPAQPSSHSCSSAPSGALVTSTGYSQGVVTSTTDALSHSTTMSNFACDGALPQTITLPDGNHVAYQYDCNTGKVTSVQDQNDINSSKATTYTYADSLNRVTQAAYPDGGSTTVDYHGDEFPLTMTVTKATGESAGPIVTTKIYDGLVRVIHSSASDSVSGGTITVDTNYDAFGRTSTVSNPYRSTSDSTYGLTTTSYDVLSRTIQVAHPDGTSQFLSYNGNIVTLTDEVSNQWQRSSDSLGELVKVMEPNGSSHSPSMETDYSYDPLGNLLTVTQCGSACPSSSTRTRSFIYDGASRLQSASNPETGTVIYTYDANGNVLTRTDARNVKTTYSYDVMNRLQSKIYSDTVTPISCYQYSTSSLSCGSGSGNLIGRLTNAWTQKAGTTCSSSGPTAGQYVSLKSVLCYDLMGRPTSAQQQQCIGSHCSGASPYSLTLAYDLAGNVQTQTNSVGAQGSPLTLTQVFDGAGLPCLLTSSWNASSSFGSAPLNLFQTNPSTTSLGYSSFGALQNWYLGSNSAAASSNCGATPSSQMNLQQTFNKRLWVTSFSSSGQVP